MNNLSNDGGEACSGIEEGITDIVQGKVGMEISSGRKARRLSQKGHCKKEAPHGFITNLITKLNAENPHLFRTMIIWMAFRLGGKEPVSGTNKRGTCPFVDMESAATGLGARNLSLELIEEDLTEEVNKSLTKGKCSAQSSVQSRQWKPFKVPEDFPTTNDPKISETISAMSLYKFLLNLNLQTLENQPNKQFLSQDRLKDIDCMPLNPLENFPGTLRRQNLAVDDFPVTPESQENGHSDFCGPRVYTSKHTLENQPNKQSLSQDRLKENLSSCLSSDLARRLCSFEWFYTAIDYP
ncbi:hypothetical protein V6N13_120976 [Hibiscus sabdariffa]